MNIGKNIASWFSPKSKNLTNSETLSEELHHEILLEINVAAATRARYILVITFLLELLLIVFYDLNLLILQGTQTVRVVAYLFLHIAILLAAFFGILLSNAILKQPRISIKKRVGFTQISAILAWTMLACAVFINYLDQQIMQSITVYTTTVLLISVLLSVQPPLNIYVFLSCHILFIFSMLHNPYTGESAIPNIINGTFTAAAAVIISTTFFHNFYERTYNTIMLREANKKLEFLSTRDTLTGLYNRRFFYDYMSHNVLYLERYKIPCSLIILDLDDFKLVNDSYGHSFGDTVLVAFAQLLINQSRESDLVIRWGGEEFVMVLFKTDAETALHFVNKLLTVQEQTPFEVAGKTIHITASAGIVNVKGVDEQALDEAFMEADTALYQAKHAGKNCARVSIG